MILNQLICPDASLPALDLSWPKLTWTPKQQAGWPGYILGNLPTQRADRPAFFLLPSFGQAGHWTEVDDPTGPFTTSEPQNPSSHNVPEPHNSRPNISQIWSHKMRQPTFFKLYNVRFISRLQGPKKCEMFFFFGNLLRFSKIVKGSVGHKQVGRERKNSKKLTERGGGGNFNSRSGQCTQPEAKGGGGHSW